MTARLPWGGADDRLSRCASALLALSLRELHACEELLLYRAPRECGRDVRRHVERIALATVVAHGFTASTFQRLLTERTSPRFVYESGLCGMLPDSQDE